MSIQQEEILLKEYTTGTTLLFFSTHFDDIKDASGIEAHSSIVEINSFGQPIKVTSFDGENLWSMNSDNIYVPTQSIMSSHLTGYSYTQSIPEVVSEDRLERYKNKFTEGFDRFYSLNTGITTPNHIEYVFATYSEIEDLYVNIKLNRTFDTLDTLNIYNNLVNIMPTQESETGVVFGRLVARQNIKDEKGNNINIPLRNVPIGIFNSSETYPSSTSVDENGDRLFLNIKENSNKDEYFNFESFSADTSQYLRSASNFTSVPEHYKYITTTNENGEFIIYDVPIGNQIAVFEVDLFKQGLTKDEIALNFFPFPPNEDSALDTIPNFSFKQFPVSVVPSWGTVQTGYTELNIAVNYDLKKWATYYLPPVVYDGFKIGSAELLNQLPSLNVAVRDMSKEGFPEKNIPVVEIHDIYDKNKEHTLLWNNEFAQLKNTVKFYEHGFKAFKVPANMYDPVGFRTDSNGDPRTHPTSQGVWLAGYQFKLYYNQLKTKFRTTGFQRDWGFSNPTWRGRDNFHLNKGEGSTESNYNSRGKSFWPYDKPWSHLYPNKYKIPSIPKIKNFDRISGVGRIPSVAPYYLEQPEYIDGDLVGVVVHDNSISDKVGGYGVQYSYGSYNWFANRFSKEVTASFMYKYESGVAWNEKYSNGYEPSNVGFPVQGGVSKVVNGETYQRVECGYGYWLRPEGWPPVSAESWGDVIFTPSTKPGVGVTTNFKPGVLNVGDSSGASKVQAQNIYIDAYNLEDKDFSLALDDSAAFSEGGLDLYRIINPNNLADRGDSVIPTYAIYNFSNFYFQRGPNQIKIRIAYNTENNNQKQSFFSKSHQGGSSMHGFYGYELLEIEIRNNGSVDVEIKEVGDILSPGESKTFKASALQLHLKTLKLPGNSNFDFLENKYTTANYSMTFKNIRCRDKNGDSYGTAKFNEIQTQVINGTSVPSKVNPLTYVLTTSYGNVRTSWKETGVNKGCRTSGSFPSTNNVMDARMNGALFQVPNTSGGGHIREMRFILGGISADCGAASLNGNIITIPMQKI